MVSKFFCKPIVCLLIDPHEVLDVVRDQSPQQWDYRKSCYISNTLMQIYHIHVYLEKMNSSIFWANFKFICPNIYHFEYYQYIPDGLLYPIWVIEIYMHVLIMHASIKIWMKHQPHNCWLFGFTLCSSMDIIFNKMIHTHLQSIQNPVISSHFSGARNEDHELSIPSVTNICLV